MLHMSEARGLSLILYKISHFLTFDLDFDPFGPTFFFWDKVVVNSQGVNKQNWMVVIQMWGGGRILLQPWLQVILLSKSTDFDIAPI